MIIHCNCCNVNKDSSEFYKIHKEDLSGKVSLECKQCTKAMISLWNKNNSEHRKKYLKEWRSKNKELTEGYYLKRRKNNLEQIRERNNEWARNNRDKKRVYSRKTNKKIRKTAKGKLNSNISQGIRKSLKPNGKNRQRWESLVGYTVNQLKEHLEKLFDNLMKWENYGNYWHIDHKIPISYFSFATPGDPDFKKCWALENLQPLEKIENLKKGAKII